MAFLLLFGGVSKEYLHSFADHTDTVHCHDDIDGLVFESEHHHCTFLSFVLPPYHQDVQDYSIKEKQTYYLTHESGIFTHLVPSSLPAFGVRGPPTILFS